MICIFSDSHGNTDNMRNIIEKEKPERIFFLGDGLQDLKLIRAEYPEIILEAVCGNCDSDASFPPYIVTQAYGQTVFFTHGHLYNVRWDESYTNLRFAAMEQGASYIFFGHTHRPVCERGVLNILNPGSVGHAGTYGVLYQENNQVHINIKRLD